MIEEMVYLYTQETDVKGKYMAWAIRESDDVATPVKMFGERYTSWTMKEPLPILESYLNLTFPNSIYVTKERMLALQTLCGCQKKVTTIGSNLCPKCQATLNGEKNDEWNSDTYTMWKMERVASMMGSKEKTRMLAQPRELPSWDNEE